MKSVRHLSLLAALSLAAPAAEAQGTFSIDYGGPTIALPDSFGGVQITEGDLLVAPAMLPTLGPLPQPGIAISGGGAGLGLLMHAGCVGHPPGVACGVEVDAHSFGQDGPAWQGLPPASWWFSVDEFATSWPAIAVPPNTDTEGSLMAMEASADLFVDLGLPAGPLPPFAVPPANVGAIDGNGFRSATLFAYPGLGLLEWNPPGLPPDLGDNVDSFDLHLPAALPPTYFSLDSPFLDPLLGLLNGASAALNGPFVGGDVLMSPGGGLGPVVYAPAMALGLDILGGPDSDDLDALALWENGIVGFQPSMTPYDWIGGGTDMLLFSVRRGSAVIGSLDSFFGIPIEEGDILTTPVAGGLSSFPGIFIAAENLGLATMRSGGPGSFGDDLDALALANQYVFDCNVNGQEDAIDIVTGTSLDCNLNGYPDFCDIRDNRSADLDGNGVPDECEHSVMTYYCTAKVNSGGCTPIIAALGTPSATGTVYFELCAVNVITNKNGMLFYGYSSAAIPFHGAWLCVQPPLRRTTVLQSGWGPWADCSGSYTYDFGARIQSGVDPALVAGVPIYAQYWHRDPADPAGFGTGLSDAAAFVITP